MEQPNTLAEWGEGWRCINEKSVIHLIEAASEIPVFSSCLTKSDGEHGERRINKKDSKGTAQACDQMLLALDHTVPSIDAKIEDFRREGVHSAFRVMQSVFTTSTSQISPLPAWEKDPLPAGRQGRGEKELRLIHLGQNPNDPLSGFSVAEGVPDVCHLPVFFRSVQQFLSLAEDPLFLGPH